MISFYNFIFPCVDPKTICKGVFQTKLTELKQALTKLSIFKLKLPLRSYRKADLSVDRYLHIR